MRQRFRYLSTVCAIFAFLLATDLHADKPVITRLGTIDCDMVETDPVVFKDRLYRFEYVRATRYKPNKTGDSYFRFIDVATGEPTASFAAGCHLGSAHAEGDTMYVYGVNAWGGDRITVFWSKDLTAWESKTALELPSWRIFNNSVCRDSSRYIMAFEIGAPPAETGAAFTMRFAASKNLLDWKLTPSNHVYTKKRYSACGDIHFLDGWYYMIYLEALKGYWAPYIVRSRDLVSWETSLHNPVMKHSDADRKIANPHLTEQQKQRIATARNANNSDVGLCDFNGKTVIYYSWGNQHGTEHLAEAVYDGSVRDFLRSFFVPRIDVTRSVYAKHPRKAVSVWRGVYYIGDGLVREEIKSFMAKSDTPEEPQVRRSEDNGKTWSAFAPHPKIVTHEKGARIFWGGWRPFYDPAAGVHVSIWLRQTRFKGVYHNHCFYRLSFDGARTWTDPKQFTYEEGKTFDSEKPLDPAYLWKNEVYPGNNIVCLKNGTIVWAGAAVNVPHENKEGKSYHPWVAADAKSIGSVCFAGTWDAEKRDYRWKAGKPVWVPLSVSSRGLMEPEVAELSSGKLLVIWRGSNTPKTAGRKWFSTSTDGGMTLAPVRELAYDDGSRFYSPSSIHRMIRWSVNGKLYWIGNICTTPPRANSPRYPLVLVEVDEEIPALKRDTVTVIDRRRAGDSARLQLSNFSLLENRETHALEIYLTRLGEDPDDFWGADCYRYTLKLFQ